MTEDSLPLAELLAKAGDNDFLRSVAEAVVGRLVLGCFNRLRKFRCKWGADLIL